MSLHIATVENPYHLSVGAVVVDRKNKTIGCQYVKEYLGDTEIYLVMRESLEDGETPEEAVKRGLMEEMGIDAKIQRYIGSIVSSFMREEEKVEKTTLYYLCELTNFDLSRRDENDEDASNDIVWLPIDELIAKSSDQFQRSGRDDFDESKILERAKKYIA